MPEYRPWKMLCRQSGMCPPVYLCVLVYVLGVGIMVQLTTVQCREQQAGVQAETPGSRRPPASREGQWLVSAPDRQCT